LPAVDNVADRLLKLKPPDPPDTGILGVRFEHFVLRPEGKAKRPLDIVSRLRGEPRFKFTIDGSPEVRIPVSDDDGAILNGDLLTTWAWGRNADVNYREEAQWIRQGQRLDALLARLPSSGNPRRDAAAVIGDWWFRLVRVERDAQGLTLVFEARESALMRDLYGPHKQERTPSMTRIKYCGWRAIAAGVHPWIPEQGIFIGTDPKDPQEKTAKTGDREMPKTATVNGTRVTPQQRKDMTTALQEAFRLRAPDRAIICMLCAGTGESTWRRSAVSPSGQHKGIFQSNQIPPDQVALQARHFLIGGRSFKAGGAIQMVRENPNMPVGDIAGAVEISGRGNEYYGKFTQEAVRNFKLWGGTVATSEGAERYEEKPYQFEQGKDENAWDCTGRLMREIDGRRFIRAGRVWICTDKYLFAQKPSFAMALEKPGAEAITGVSDIGFEIDLYGKDLVAEVRATVRVSRWAVLPGQVVTLADELGPASGKWLVHTYEREFTDSEAVVTLRKPVKTKPEPSAGFNRRGGTNRPDPDRVRKWRTLKNATPKDIIDKVVLPIARKNGINITAAQVAAANARHGPTVSGGRSDHQGPPSERWAADISNGSSPTKQMDALAKELAEEFGIPGGPYVFPAGASVNTESGFRFQLIYRVSGQQNGGNHQNHVHFGARNA
jgi:hypothetical protein